MPAFHLATFAADITPPLGHPLCGGWIEPVRGVDDPLKALGVVLLGMGKPVVLCALDWCGIRNDAHLLWRKALADAAHTSIEQVAIQTVHPHNAPFADTEAEKLIAAAPNPTSSLDLQFFDRAVSSTAEALRAALAKTRRFTHVGTGQGRVEQVASNRRVLGDDGKVKWTRTSATRNKEARDAADGTIDPFLKTLSFWDGDTPLAALNYYATHPMSYYGDGQVSADFCGLARQQRQDADPSVFQVYFTGCAGNVTAGKYNDGAKENRAILRDRMVNGMAAARAATKRQEVTGWEWRVRPLRFEPRPEKSFSAEASRQVLQDPKQKPAARNNAAYQLAWLKRLDRPIDLGCLDFGSVLVAHLPGEPFIEYQLAAQVFRPDAFVCVAGYGDDGCGYIPTSEAFYQGGYEPTVALASSSTDFILKDALRRILQKP